MIGMKNMANVTNKEYGHKIYLRLGCPATIPDYCRKLPEFECFPRDFQLIERTNDVLFQTMVLENMRSDRRFLKRFYNNTTKNGYYLEKSDGTLLHPINLTPIKIIDCVEKQRLGGKALRRNIIGFYFIRKLLIAKHNQTIKVNDVVMFEDGIKSPEVDNFFKSLSWSLSDDDLILKHFNKMKFFTKSNTEMCFDAICPLDGTVQVSRIDVLSPLWTWESLCGRHYEYIVCPHCLGTFTSKLVALN